MMMAMNDGNRLKYCMGLFAILACFFLLLFGHTPRSYAMELDEDSITYPILGDEDVEKRPDNIITLEPDTLGFSSEIMQDDWPDRTKEDVAETIGYSQGAVTSDIAAIRQNLDILLYMILPLGIAALVLIKLCGWFYSTFIKSAL